MYLNSKKKVTNADVIIEFIVTFLHSLVYFAKSIACKNMKMISLREKGVINTLKHIAFKSKNLKTT